METTTTNPIPERIAMTTPTTADLTNVTPGSRAAREAFTALVREHQRELEERGIPTGPNAGPAPERTTMTSPKLTDASLNLFTELANDAGNWAGQPLFDGDDAQRGNLTHLKKVGLVTTFVEDDGCVFVIFTDAGIAYATELGIPSSVFDR